MVVAWDAALLQALVGPPTLVRAALVGGAIVVALVLLREALIRLSDAGLPGGTVRDLPRMIRGIRFVFLAVAAAAAAVGWAIAHPLPLIVGLIIAAIDVIETSFLLLVVTVRGGTEAR
jgi:hypothetical protein